MAQDKIIIKGAREHNLKNISLELPRDKMIVFTGLSGSGKSSLAFDTIFAEGQRRYIESLSAYARQFLGRLDKPDVDEIEGLSPAISIDQKHHSANPRSTVATITEIYDYMRVLFSRAGTPFCPVCGNEIRRMAVSEIVDVIAEMARAQENAKEIIILAPVVSGRKGEYYQLLYDFLGNGFQEARVDGEFRSLRERVDMARYKRHNIDILIDRIHQSTDFGDKDNRMRLSEAVELAIKHGNGSVTLVFGSKKGGEETMFSSKFACPRDNFSFPEIEPRLFSFNSPYGACEQCHGLGTESVWSEKVCETCRGRRLRPEALSVLIADKNIAEVSSMPIADAVEFFKSLEGKLSDARREIATAPLREIGHRLKFMMDIGLDYLTLDRKAGTLSGGESQRIRLASQIGSRLVGALYILDEPTIGLHQRDNAKLVQTLLELRDLGNTIVVVEHDEDTIRAADYLVDFGPGAGVHGGDIVASGKVSDLIPRFSRGAKSAGGKEKKDKNIAGAKNSLTVKYLNGELGIPVPEKRRSVSKPMDALVVNGASQNNLKDIKVEIPLRRLTVITGVSGSGKSTLVYDVIYKALANKMNKANYKVGAHKDISGLQYIGRIVNVDQSPIGRTPRSNPATYVGAWTAIRELFSQTPDARVRGWKPGRFSFNVRGGRCENCEGHGQIGIEMHFLPTVYVACDACQGKRFERETLEVRYKDKNIYDVLRMTVEEAAEFFKDIPWLYDRLNILNEVGLGYLEIGQSATTLSGGEAQRIKLAKELGKYDAPKGRHGERRSLYILDEPTTGLHFADVEKLISVLQRLVDRGNTVVVIEHNLDVIKSADWVIDLGPEGGDKGGEIVAVGTPEQIAGTKGSFTGEYLRKTIG